MVYVKPVFSYYLTIHSDTSHNKLRKYCSPTFSPSRFRKPHRSKHVSGSVFMKMTPFNA